jgi:thiamine-phosphate pyrophosphorylase
MGEAWETLLLERIAAAAAAGVDWIQIREKDLAAVELAEFATRVIRSVPASCRVIVNDRLDVALAVAAGGVHLGEKSIPIEEAKRLVRERGEGKKFLIGASVHSLIEAEIAERDGADYVIFGPVFATPSKVSFGEPQGPQRLKALCSGVSIPVLAIGGITELNGAECYAHGASGVAAIRLFQGAGDLGKVVQQLRRT